jgi:hypothetical protein
MDRLNDLADRGYDCYIIAGFEYVKQVIDEYLNK